MRKAKVTRLFNDLSKSEKVIILKLIDAQTLKELGYDERDILGIANVKLRELKSEPITQNLLRDENY